MAAWVSGAPSRSPPWWARGGCAGTPPGLFALYVTGYSAFRIFEESLRVDPSEHFLGLRLNMYIASAVALAGAAWFWHTQRRPRGGTPAPSTARAVRPASAGQERQ